MLTNPGPYTAFRPRLPNWPIGLSTNTLGSNHFAILSCFERLLDSTGFPLTSGRSNPFAENDRSCPVVTLSGGPVCAVRIGVSSHPPRTLFTTAFQWGDGMFQMPEATKRW